MMLGNFRSPLLFCVQFIRRRMSSLPKTFVNYRDDDPNICISFFFSNGVMERHFNFIRNKEEAIKIALSRMETNIVKALLGSRKKKKKPNEGEGGSEIPRVPLLLKMNADPVDPDTRNIDAWKDGALFTIGEVNYSVCINYPTIKNISLPGSIMAGFAVYPKIELTCADAMQCRYEWFTICAKKDLVARDIVDLDSLEKTKVGMYYFRVGNEYCYQTSNDDVGKKLMVRCEPRLGDRSGLVKEAESEAIEAGPGPCPFEIRHAFTQNVTIPGRIRCVSYNILADLYVDSEYSRTVLFPYCPPYALKLDYRKQLFLKEIFGYNGDLLCLQEVDSKVYKHDISPLLEASGLSGCFNEKGGQVVEGLVCLFRNSKFRLVENHRQIVADLVKENLLFSDILQKVSGNEKLATRLLARTTALQITVLESLEMENSFVVVGNTHLYFHPDADHIRLLQAYVCIRYLQDQVQNLKNKLGEGNCVSAMLFGDFNSCPEFGVYQLMTAGGVSADSPDWSSNLEEAVPGLDIQHDLRMASACGCPPYTNFTVGFQGCLDYIFYDTLAYEVEEIVPLPSHDEVTEFTALPSIVMPSDHLALVCTLRWRQQGSVESGVSAKGSGHSELIAS